LSVSISGWLFSRSRSWTSGKW